MYESLIVQISQQTVSTKDIIVGVVYKPPNTNNDTFLSHLTDLLDKLNKENRPCYLLGDYNIDLLKYTTHSESFLNQLLTYGFFPKIDRATRITNTAATLIDNILTNVHDQNLVSGIWTASVSDHLPVYVTLPHQFAKCKSRNRFELRRVYSTTNIEQFKNKLCNIDWSLVYDTSDVDEKYTCFLNIITDLHNTCFPLTSVKINPMKDSKPWISLSILNSVKKRTACINNT